MSLLHDEPKKRTKKKLPKVISPGEAQRLLAVIDDGTEEGVRNRLALELMYRAGLRIGEVVKLRPRDVHRDGAIDVYEAKGGDGTAYFTPSLMLETLERWLEIRGRWIAQDGVWAGADDFPLIIHRNGRKLTSRYFQRLFEKAKVAAEIDGVCTPHVLRHSFATELLEDGFSLVEVQSALRHANLQTTTVYLHVRDKALMSKMSRRIERREG